MEITTKKVRPLVKIPLRLRFKIWRLQRHLRRRLPRELAEGMPAAEDRAFLFGDDRSKP